MADMIGKRLAEDISRAIRDCYPDDIDKLAASFGFETSGLAAFIHSKLESPKDASMGDYAFPTFLLSKTLQEKPPEIAAKVFEKLDGNIFSITGPYINAKIAAAAFATAVLPEVLAQKQDFGGSNVGTGKNVVIDFSSPNIAKPFGVGHLRSTALGNSLYRIFSKLGYHVVGINHLGDWGTQFGTLLSAFEKWGRREDLEAAPDKIKYLYDLYVRYNIAMDEDEGLAENARQWFKRLEDGDTAAVDLWQLFKDFSLIEFKRIYEILGVTFDHFTGESFYVDKMDAVIERLDQAGLLQKSEGATVVDLEKYELPPCLIRKADGATLYATRDLAGIFYRQEAYKFDRALYVVGKEQTIHFRQIFKVVELLGEPYAPDLVHVDFGMIKLGGQKMSSRRGDIVFLEDVIDTAREKAREIILEKNPNLADVDNTALTIGLGAVIFADLSVKKNKDVNFVWEEVLSFEGETGPYLQYTHARLSALLRKYDTAIEGGVDYSLMQSDEEKAILKHLYKFGDVISLAAEKYEPQFISEYLLQLAADFNRFYQRKDEAGKMVRIIDESDTEGTRARMLLVWAMRIVMKEGLSLLGINAPEEM